MSWQPETQGPDLGGCMRRFDITCIHPGGVSSQPSLKTQVEKAEGDRQTLQGHVSCAPQTG